MIKKILAVIAVLWGVGIIVPFFLGASRVEGGPYGMGQGVGLGIGGLLIVGGLYYLLFRR
jgi:hypothetical protein